MSTCPVFIVGVNGSGTTMLADALGRHPDLYFPPDESRVIPYFAQRYSDAALASRDKRRELANLIGSSRAFRRANAGRPVVLTDCDSIAPRFSAVVGAVFEFLAHQKSKSRWGDKSPMYLQHLDALSRRFEDAKFIHIFRDGRDAAQSFHRRWNQDPRRAIYRWKRAVSMGSRQGHALEPGRYLEVQYEALTRNPEEGMRGICDFLELPFDQSVLGSKAYMMESERREEAAGRIVENSERWREYFSVETVRQLESIAGKLLSELGYPVTTQGDIEPFFLRLYLWKQHDRMNFVFHHIRSFGLGGVPKLLLRIRDSLRQDSANRF